MPIELVMPSSHLILCRPLLLLPPIPPSIRVFSNLYYTVANDGEFLYFIEVFQLIKKEEMMKLEYHHLATPDKLMYLRIICNIC